MSTPEDSLPPWWKTIVSRQAPAPTTPTHPAPMDIAGNENELDAFRQRGGKIDPSSQYAKYGTKYPGGTYGGEFSDEEMTAYMDAARKLGMAKAMQHLQPALAEHDRMAQRPDATTVKK